jgi:hypothetical protein
VPMIALRARNVVVGRARKHGKKTPVHRACLLRVLT